MEGTLHFSHCKKGGPKVIFVLWRGALKFYRDSVLNKKQKIYTLPQYFGAVMEYDLQFQFLYHLYTGLLKVLTYQKHILHCNSNRTTRSY